MARASPRAFRKATAGLTLAERHNLTNRFLRIVGRHLRGRLTPEELDKLAPAQELHLYLILLKSAILDERTCASLPISVPTETHLSPLLIPADLSGEARTRQVLASLKGEPNGDGDQTDQPAG